MDGRDAVIVVVPARDEAAFVGACLESLADQRGRGRVEPPSFEVVVVDDASKDETADVVRRAAAAIRAPRITLLRTDGAHRGVAAARRTGMEWAAARLEATASASASTTSTGRRRAILASTDADARVAPTWIAEIVALFAARPEVGFAGGDAAYPTALAAEMAGLRHYAATWRKLGELVAPIRYVETIGCNFAIDVPTYRAIGGMPLLTVGEDLAVAELATARGAIGAHLPIANAVSDRRAVGDPIDFLTAKTRYAAWGSHGRVAFQPHRATAGAPRPSVAIAAIAADVDAERELTARGVDYFCRHHLIKPLVLVPAFRRPILDPLAAFGSGVDVATFDDAVARAEAAHPASAPFYLEDRILDVERRVFGPIRAALDRALAASSVSEAPPAPGEIPFHCAFA